jgi:hypothetical protein
VRLELSNDENRCVAVNPDELRKEATSAELMARVVSYQPDKQWLIAKAAELRRLAERTEARCWELRGRSCQPPDSKPPEQ